MSEETLSQEELDALLAEADIVTNDEPKSQPTESSASDQATEEKSVATKEASSAPAGGGEQAAENNKMTTPQQNRNIQLLLDIYMNVTVELGRTNMKVKDILGLGEGSIIELDKPANEKVELLVNNRLVARGEVVVIDENFGVRVNEIVDPKDRMALMMK